MSLAFLSKKKKKSPFGYTFMEASSCFGDLSCQSLQGMMISKYHPLTQTLITGITIVMTYIARTPVAYIKNYHFYTTRGFKPGSSHVKVNMLANSTETARHTFYVSIYSHSLASANIYNFATKSISPLYAL